MTFQSAAYVARYVCKKILGPKAQEHYTVVDGDTGEILGERDPEFVAMSRRPGIGAEWFKKFHGDLYPDGRCVVPGTWKVQRIPKYYDKLMEGVDIYELEKMKDKRMVSAWLNAERDLDRLEAMEIVKAAKVQRLPRSLE